ncbi:DUF6789 family protein [Halobaculum lipolyticum]|uniref:DUF6789 family protein n=1 Tax=Halobaculum lipolyticum TaxID=3032001 RepID=A0ABD5WCA5_9EURY|nr:DUF6789 family protein [Halobaculum sp. DT31]
MTTPPVVATPEERLAVGIDRRISLRDVLVACAAGLLGSLAMVPLFLVAWALGALSPDAFAALGTLLGAAPGSTAAFLLGSALFVGGGATTFALLFVALVEYLPPERSVGLRGAVFAAVIWLGFLGAFHTGQTGLALFGYAVLTLNAHLAYGFVLGRVYGRYALDRAPTAAPDAAAPAPATE